MFPAIWLTSPVVQRMLAASNSGGPAHFIALVLASMVLNIALYTIVFFTLFKARDLLKRKHSATPHV